MENKTQIIVGRTYKNYQSHHRYEIISIDEPEEVESESAVKAVTRVTFKTLHSNNVTSKTLAYCEKYFRGPEEIVNE